MALLPINRTEHDVPGAPGVSRPGSTSHAEDGLDLTQYLRPLEQAHASALHGRGVAAGLAVSADAGSAMLRVTPGVAVDAQGRHIVLAPGGSVETAENPDQASRLVPVTEAGVELSATGLSGPILVVVQWRETFDATLPEGPHSDDRFVTRHTPWLQLTGTTADPQRDLVVLATVVLDAAGRVTAGGVTPDRRDTLTLGSGGLRLRGATTSGPSGTPGMTVAETDAAALRPRPGGGLEVQVPAGAAAPLSISAEGRVGIGTTTPGELLDVAGAATVAGALTVDGLVQVKQDLAVGGRLNVRKSSGNHARLTGEAFANEGVFAADTLKVVMGSARFLSPIGGGAVTPFQFMVGYSRFNPIDRTLQFVRRFSVDEDGNAFFAGGKGGYVVDYFVNAVGDALEQGDVVVLRGGTPVAHYGSHGAIPIPEVDLTDRPYDGRVCGIVADVVGPGGLPTVDEEPPERADEPARHPLAGYAADADQPRTTVRDRQLGRMVTLGAWAHCKVDADVAPVETGDLLTTSPTPGHAQKVTDPHRAPGAVVGKAMAPLPAGRGTIPVLVSLH